MKAILLLSLFLAIQAEAQTNFFPLLNVGATTYTNARITSVTAADAIVLFDGGGARVPLSNMPPHIQKQYGYDAGKAAKSLAEQTERNKKFFEANKKQNAELQRKDAWRGDLQAIRVRSVGRPIGSWYQCEIATTNGVKASVLLGKMPLEIKRYYERSAQLKKDIADRANYTRREAQRLSNLEDNSPSEAPFDSPAGRRIRQMNIDSKALAASLQELKEWQGEYKEMLAGETTAITCFARPTAKSYGNLAIWECE